MSSSASGEQSSHHPSFRISSYSSLANWKGGADVPQQSVPVPDPEAILADFYHRKSKKPTRQEQYELSRASGFPPGTVAEFLRKRDADLSWTALQPAQTSWDIQKPRTRFTAEQKQILEAHFQLNTRPGPIEQAQLAVELGVTPDKIYNWFDRKRRPNA
ncbi:hypothetical protein C8T65DRAFT_737265 [Cerioporus squamosus]|nr:hypothetical protein C8T65DRAFT_737265 [Cerioporus squamosus]